MQITNFILVASSETTLSWLSPVIAVSGILISAAVGFVIAIFGDDIRGFCRKPKLVIMIPDTEGEWTVITADKKIVDQAVYFHVLLRNQKPTRIARDVELYVTECVISDTERKSVRLPLPCPLPIQARRRHGGVEVGAAPFAYDLFKCLKTGRIELLLNCNRPNNFTSWIKREGEMTVKIEARGVNAVSNKLEVRITWDGVFPMEAEGLGEHLIVTSRLAPRNKSKYSS